MTQVVIIPKIGKSMSSIDPNDFIFHSQYNTLKIIQEGTISEVISVTTDYIVTKAHGLFFAPLVIAFCNLHGEDAAFTVGGGSLALYGTKLGLTYDIKLLKIVTDISNIRFVFDTNSAGKQVHIRYFVLDGI